MKKILVVVDMQNDFLTGSLANESAVKIIPNIINEIKSGKYSHIIFTRDTHKENYFDTQEGKLLPVEHCIEGSEGWDVAHELYEAAADVSYNEGVEIHYLNKHTFGYKNWSEYLETIVYPYSYEVVFTGTCTDICVVSNALAVKSAYPELVVSCIGDCCAPLFGSEEKQNSALSVMQSCQINVI